MTIFLETKRLIIKTPSIEDLDDLYQLQSDPEVMQYITGYPRTRIEVEDILKKSITHYQKYNFSAGSVFEKSSNKFIGRAGIHYLAFDDTQKLIEIGYVLKKNYWQKGYATEIAKSLIAWGFKNLNVESLTGAVDPNNEASRKVLEKVGMHYVRLGVYRNKKAAFYEITKNNFNFNDVKLTSATLKDYPIIKNLARFYAYDISEFYGAVEGWEMEDNGLYGVGINYKNYFNNSKFLPFLIFYRNNLAGFFIIEKLNNNFSMTQFCILRMYKGKGLGKFVAYSAFEQFPGNWEIMVMPKNEGAYRFWRKIIKEYTQNNFEEYTTNVKKLNDTERNFFRFVSKKT